jgi:hypothetical protein
VHLFIPIDRARLSAHLGRELNDPQAAADHLEKFFNLDLHWLSPSPSTGTIGLSPRRASCSQTPMSRTAGA